MISLSGQLTEQSVSFSWLYFERHTCSRCSSSRWICVKCISISVRCLGESHLHLPTGEQCTLGPLALWSSLNNHQSGREKCKKKCKLLCTFLSLQMSLCEISVDLRGLGKKQDALTGGWDGKNELRERVRVAMERGRERERERDR